MFWGGAPAQDVIAATINTGGGGTPVVTSFDLANEVLAAQKSDHALATEFSSTQRGDAAVPIELPALRNADLGLPVEWSGAVGVVADEFAPIEVNRLLRDDSAVPLEFGAVLTRGSGTALELSLTALADAATPLEFLGALRAAPALPAAALAALRVDPPAAGEFSTLLVRAAGDPIEWLGATGILVDTDTLIAIEFLAAPALLVSLQRLLRSPGRRRLIVTPGRLRILGRR